MKQQSCINPPGLLFSPQTPVRKQYDDPYMGKTIYLFVNETLPPLPFVQLLSFIKSKQGGCLFCFNWKVRKKERKPFPNIGGEG